MKTTLAKPVGPVRNYEVNYARYSYLRTQSAKRHNVMPLIRGKNRLDWRDRNNGLIDDDLKRAVVLSKNNLHGWAQRSSDEQGWVGYVPLTPNDFRAKRTDTLKEALQFIAGLLYFTELERMEVRAL